MSALPIFPRWSSSATMGRNFRADAHNVGSVSSTCPALLRHGSRAFSWHSKDTPIERCWGMRETHGHGTSTP